VLLYDYQLGEETILFIHVEDNFMQELLGIIELTIYSKMSMANFGCLMQVA